jgi:hypothetical protein
MLETEYAKVLTECFVVRSVLTPIEIVSETTISYGVKGHEEGCIYNSENQALIMAHAKIFDRFMKEKVEAINDFDFLSERI